MNYNILGSNIRQCRKSLKMTQEVLSETISVSPMFISQIENGARKPSLETVYKISIALNVSLDELVKNTHNTIELPKDSEINTLLKDRTNKEIMLVTNVARELLRNLNENTIKD